MGPHANSPRLFRMLFQLIAVLAALGLSGQAQSVEGLWRSEGYGMALDVQGPNLKSFELTVTTCVLGEIAQRDNTGIADREATFKSTGGDVFFIRSGGTTDHKLLHNEWLCIGRAH